MGSKEKKDNSQSENSKYPVKYICQCNECTPQKNFKYTEPPDPPNDDDIWDLQFCRWWGWNWVKRREVEVAKSGVKDDRKRISHRRSTRKDEETARENEQIRHYPSKSRRRHREDELDEDRQTKGTCCQYQQKKEQSDDADEEKQSCCSRRQKRSKPDCDRCHTEKPKKEQSRSRKERTHQRSREVTNPHATGSDEELKGCCQRRPKRPKNSEGNKDGRKSRRRKAGRTPVKARGEEEVEGHKKGCLREKSENSERAREDRDRKSRRQKRAKTPARDVSDEEEHGKKCCPRKRRKERSASRPRQKHSRRKLEDSESEEVIDKRSSKNIQQQRISRGQETQRTRLPTKDELREMCKCILGKNQNAPCGMASLFNTPSASKMAVQGYPKCSSYPITTEKGRRKSEDDQRKAISASRLLDEGQRESSKPVEGAKKIDKRSTTTEVRSAYQKPEKLDAKKDSFKPCCTCRPPTTSGVSTDCRKDISEEVITKKQSYKQMKTKKGTSTSQTSSDREKYVSEEVIKKQSYQQMDTKKGTSSSETSTDHQKHVSEPVITKTQSQRSASSSEAKWSGPSDSREQPTVSQKCGCPEDSQKPVPDKSSKQEMKKQDIQQQSFSSRQVIRDPPRSALKMPERSAGEQNVYQIDLESSETFERDFSEEEKGLKIKSKKYKTLYIRVCCCGNCKPCIDENNDSKTGKDSKKEKKCPIDSGKSCFCKNFDKRSEDAQTVYPVIVPPTSMTKIFSKFGTPSKNYPWMQNMGSDATTTTLDDLGVYKSPVTGKAYNLSTLDCVSNEQVPLPDLIDISEDLSYLKKLETITASENENRLLLDAVCDAILQEHEEKALNILTDDLLKTGVLQKNSDDFNFVNDLNNEFCEKNGPYEDVGIQLSKTYLNSIIFDPSVTLGDVDLIIGRIMEKIFADSTDDITNNQVHEQSNPDSYTARFGERQCKKPFIFTGNENMFFNDTTRLLGGKRSNIFKKPKKRFALNFNEGENSNKKLKQEEENKEINPFTTQTNNKIENIFAKIDHIVKQSEVKNAMSQKVLNISSPVQEPTSVFSESFLRSQYVNHSLNQNCLTKRDFESIIPAESNPFVLNSDRSYSKYDFESGNSTESNVIPLKRAYEGKKIESNTNFLKKFYTMSSDAFQGDIYQSGSKVGKKSYEIFSEKFHDYKSSCSGIATKVIFEEKNGLSAAENNSEIVCNNETSTEQGIKYTGKVPKLSVENFLVCDEKSSVIQKSSNSGVGVKNEKKPIKRKKTGSGSFIPVRKQGTSGETQ